MKENKVILSVEVKADGATDGLKKIDKNLKDTKETADKAKKSVKGVSESLEDIPGAAGDAAQGLKGILSQFKALIASPIGIILTAVAGAIALMYKGLSALNPVLDTFEDIMSGVSEASSALFTNVGNFITGQKEANISLQDAYKYGKQAAQAAREYEDGMRDLNLQNAIFDRQIDLLIRKSKNRAITEAERNRLLKEALELQEKQILKNREILKAEGESLAYRVKSQGGTFAQLLQVQKGVSVASMNIQSKALEDLLFEYQAYVAKRIQSETGFELQRERIRNASDANELKANKEANQNKLTKDEELQQKVAERFKDYKTQRREMEMEERIAEDAERERRGWELIEQEKAIEEQITNNAIEEGKKRMAISESEAQARIDTIGAIGMALEGFSMLAEEQSQEAKDLASANALINTYLAANQVLADKTLPTVAKAFAVAGIVAAGLANVKRIQSIDAKGGNSQAPSAPPPVVRPTSSFTVLDNQQPIKTTNEGGKIKVYVTESDITNAQNKVNSIKAKATI